MKKFLSALMAVTVAFVACQKYDDSALQNRIGNLEGRVTTLESQVTAINGDISSLRTLVQALQNSITISVISQTKDGFTVTFSDGQSVEIKNGTAGPQGKTPVVGVKADGGVYYWTVDGEWLLDAAGKKVAVTGGTPAVKIEDGHWFVSYDGTTWQDLGEAGIAEGSTDITMTADENFVYFTSRSTGETITISKTDRFTIDLSATDFFIKAGEKVEIPYTITGADGTEHLFIQGEGVTCSYDAEKIYVTPAEGVTEGSVLLYAVRNSDQRVCALVLSFAEGVFEVTTAARIPAAGGDASVTVRTNQTYEVSIPADAQSWLSVAVATKAAVREDAVTFTALPNEGTARTANVTLTAESGTILTVAIYQEGGETVSPGTPAGTGTETDPFNVAAAIAKALETGETATADSYYIKGKIVEVKEEFAARFGNATFTMIDEGMEDAVFTAYRILYFYNQKWAEGDLQVKAGDEVVVYAQIVNFKSDTPETSGGYLYSLNGEKGVEPTPVEPSEAKSVTVAEFLAAPESETQKYELVGTIGGSINTTYGNFDLTDETGTVYVYGLTATELGYGASNDKSYASLNLSVGDKIKLHGYRGSYGDKIEVVYAWFVEKLADGGQGSGGGEATGAFDSNVGWTLDSSAYTQTATVNGTEGVTILKLGTGSKYGTATITLPSGATQISFYGVSWNNADAATLVFKDDGKEVGSVSLSPNAGLKGNPTYELTVTDSDYYTVKFGSAVESITVETTGGYRAALFAIQAK